MAGQPLVPYRGSSKVHGPSKPQPSHSDTSELDRAAPCSAWCAGRKGPDYGNGGPGGAGWDQPRDTYIPRADSRGRSYRSRRHYRLQSTHQANPREEDQNLLFFLLQEFFRNGICTLEQKRCCVALTFKFLSLCLICNGRENNLHSWPRK